MDRDSGSAIAGGRTCSFVLTWILIYMTGYVGLSCLGDYSQVPAITHHRHYMYGFGYPDAYVWEPVLIEVTRYGQPLVYVRKLLWGFSYPLYQLDRKLWHKDLWIEELDASSLVFWERTTRERMLGILSLLTAMLLFLLNVRNRWKTRGGGSPVKKAVNHTSDGGGP